MTFAFPRQGQHRLGHIATALSAVATHNPFNTKRIPMNQVQLPTAIKSLALSGALAGALAGALLAASTTASAAVITFTDPAAFTAAAGAVQTENFNRFTSDFGPVGYGNPGPERNFDFGAFRMIGSADAGWQVDAPTTVNPIDGTTNLFLTFYVNSGYDFRFAAPTTSFGFSYAGRRDDLGVGAYQVSRVSFAADALNGFGSYTDLGSVELGNGSTPRFVGVTSTVAFNRIFFAGLGCCNTSFSIDNVMYTGVAAVPGPGGSVPVPGSLPLVASALGLLALRRRATASRGH